MSDNSEFDRRQEAYERAYYQAAGAASSQGQPFCDPDAPAPAAEQYHADPLVAAVSEATQQRAEGRTYQQPWDTASQQASAYGYDYGYQQAYDQASYGQQQTYTPYVASKDHVAAGLLALFLGSFGIHKFYLGYNNAGFIMLGISIIGSLFTLGIAGAVMSTIGFVEGIIYLTKNQSSFDAQYVYGRKEWF